MEEAVMICWQCSTEIDLIYESSDFSLRLYHCAHCARWFEMKKQKERINSSVPVTFLELDREPLIPSSGGQNDLIH